MKEDANSPVVTDSQVMDVDGLPVAAMAVLDADLGTDVDADGETDADAEGEDDDDLDAEGEPDDGL
jgi:hypothetical protein